MKISEPTITITFTRYRELVEKAELHDYIKDLMPDDYDMAKMSW